MKPNKKKLPIIRPGTTPDQITHTLTNRDLFLLHSFFHPLLNQKHITGTIIAGFNVPRLLEALGYEVQWPENSEESIWQVKIPDELVRKSDIKHFPHI